MTRVLLVQPSLLPPGGGNGVANWMIQALRDDHEVTVLTWQPIDVARVNRYYGTSLRPADLRVLRVPARWRWPVQALPTPVAHLRRCVLLRACRRIADAYDVVVTAHNEADFGPRRGVQYVHYPWTHERPRGDVRWYHLTWLVNAYYRACEWLGGIDFERMKANVTLANSAWTAGLLRDRLGVEARVLHPPIAGEFPDTPWERRRDGFVCLGRFSREKRLGALVEIVERLREGRPDLTLSIVASGDDAVYESEIRAFVRARPWVTIHSDIARSDLIELLATHRWGIHGMSAEHFGMAVAELVRAGCVVFAPHDGGQVEILDDERLTYADADDAVAKIRAVMDDAELLLDLREHLEARGAAFSAERFMTEVREVVGGLTSAPGG